LPAFNVPSGGSSNEYIGYAYATNATLYTIPFDVPSRVPPTGVTVTTGGGIVAFALNAGTNVTPTFNQGTLYSGSVIAAPPITAGQGSRLQFLGGAGILFTGCEL
jgi:hypothetical protein